MSNGQHVAVCADSRAWGKQGVGGVGSREPKIKVSGLSVLDLRAWKARLERAEVEGWPRFLTSDAPSPWVIRCIVVQFVTC